MMVTCRRLQQWIKVDMGKVGAELLDGQDDGLHETHHVLVCLGSEEAG